MTAVGDHAGEGTGQQDADQQPAHERADHPAALVVGRQRRRVGDEHLDDHGRDAAQRDGRGEHGQVGGEGRARQRDGAEREQPGEQRAAAHDVTSRHDEQQPGRVAELPERYQERGAALADVQ
jgi:hypothetical protein